MGWYHWLAKDPAIVSYAALPMDQGLPAQRVYHLRAQSWHTEPEELQKLERRHLAWRPQDVFVHLCNEEELVEALRFSQTQAVHCSHNAFIDERIYRPLGGEKLYTAVYNARFSAWKRHQLVEQIPGQTLLIGGVRTGSDSLEHFRAMQQRLPRATFTHAHDPNAWLPHQEVNQLINSAQVGLCLSACEGAMFSSIEYLLAGLPVVSTHNRGGRNHFFDGRFCRIVHPNADLVATAVEELIQLRLDPSFIRQETLKKIWPHRQRYVEVLQKIFQQERRGVDASRFLYEQFTNRHTFGPWRGKPSAREIHEQWLQSATLPV